MEKFFSSPRFAVIGASKDPSKYGNKVLKWYQNRDLDVTPVHPKEVEIEGLEPVKSLGELDAPKETSLSVITPPKVTLEVLAEAERLGIPFVWLQPGTYDKEVEDVVSKSNVNIIHGGPCVLVLGDTLRNTKL